MIAFVIVGQWVALRSPSLRVVAYGLICVLIHTFDLANSGRHLNLGAILPRAAKAVMISQIILKAELYACINCL